MRLYPFGLFFGLAIISIGALAQISNPTSPFPQVSKLPSHALQVPFARQATNYSCGAAALMGVLSYWQVFDGPESSLYAALETTEAQGTEPQKIRDVAISFGLQAEMRENLEIKDLRNFLKSGHTVILSIQAWRSEESLGKPWKDIWEEGHYVVLVAMDKDHAYVMDPSVQTSYVYLPLTELLDRWHDYEDRHGPVWRYQRLGVIIRGKTPLQKFPSSLVRMG